MATANALRLTPGEIALDDLRPVFRGPVAIDLAAGAEGSLDAGWQVIADAIAADGPVYAVNTGFGKLASTRIAPEDLVELQRRLILSHATGVGPRLPAEVVRAILVLKLVCLAQGHSGVRPILVEYLQALLAADVLPCVPAQGSVGASGDLAPLSHVAGVLMGLGTAIVDGEEIPATDALARLGLEPLALAPKEGVALINGTQV